MGRLSDRKKTRLLKMIGVGNPSTGKTGSLCEVANNMKDFGLEKLVVLDWDDGAEVLLKHISPEAAKEVYVETFRDQLKPQVDGGAPIVLGSDVGNLDGLKMKMAWARGMQMMNRWKTKDYDLGKALDWGPETLFVCDTLTGLGDAGLNFAMAILEKDGWSGTGTAMDFQDKFTQMCQSMKCHFIMFCHIRFMGGGGQTLIIDKDGKHQHTKEVDSNVDGTAYPSALGRKLPPQIARHFNTQLSWELKGKKRVVLTKGSEQLPLKIPMDLPSELPQETALVRVFKELLKE
jgi:hypothetical protein